MIIQNINTGVDHRRVQENKASFFVNWHYNGENNYNFFSLKIACENFKNRLTDLQTNFNQSTYDFLISIYK